MCDDNTCLGRLIICYTEDIFKVKFTFNNGRYNFLRTLGERIEARKNNDKDFLALTNYAPELNLRFNWYWSDTSIENYFFIILKLTDTEYIYGGPSYPKQVLSFRKTYSDTIYAVNTQDCLMFNIKTTKEHSFALNTAGVRI